MNVNKLLKGALQSLYHQRTMIDGQIVDVETALGRPPKKPLKKMKASTRRKLSAKMKARWATVNGRHANGRRRKTA